MRSTQTRRRIPDPCGVERDCRIPDEERCAAEIEREGDTYRLAKSIAMSETGRCTRRHKVTLRNRDGETMRFCATHARMALEGMVDERGAVVSRNSRNELRRYDKGPMYEGLWEETS